MCKLILNSDSVTNSKCLILLFVEGTILRPKSWIHFFNMKEYIPTENSLEKIKGWKEQGADIVYLTSRKDLISVEQVKKILIKYGFVGSFLYYRANQEEYKDIVAHIYPKILIEDDCKSIGGTWQMCITHVEKSLKNEIISVVVKEFGGLSLLPENLNELMR